MLELGVAILSVTLIAVSQLLFKSGAISTQPNRGTVAHLLDRKIVSGLALNAIAAGCWIFALRELEISYLYPILCINYLLVPLGARLCFSEPITRQRLAAIGVICLGVFICLLGGDR